jgi:protein-tyrosine phosphatase
MERAERRAVAGTVLFLCTGNYYRSRFAELYFNALAGARGVPWRAVSRGLGLTAANVGPISRRSVRELEARGVVVPEPVRHPARACEHDFRGAALVVAVKEAEHRPLLEMLFPAWAGGVEFWHVHDQDCAPPEEALPELAARVEALVERLAAPSPHAG